MMINAYTHRNDYSHLVVFLLFAIPTELLTFQNKNQISDVIIVNLT